VGHRPKNPATRPPPADRQGRWKNTLRFCAASAGGVAAIETFVSAAAMLWPTTRTRRRYIAACRVDIRLLQQRRGVAGNGLGEKIKYLRRATSSITGISLVA
jgi:hypothetical protein